MFKHILISLPTQHQNYFFYWDNLSAFELPFVWDFRQNYECSSSWSSNTFIHCRTSLYELPKRTLTLNLFLCETTPDFLLDCGYYTRPGPNNKGNTTWLAPTQRMKKRKSLQRVQVSMTPMSRSLSLFLSHSLYLSFSLWRKLNGKFLLSSTHPYMPRDTQACKRSILEFEIGKRVTERSPW